MASEPAEVPGEGADAQSGPGYPSQGNKDTADVQMAEAAELTSTVLGESDYHVSEAMADEARAAIRQADGERLARVQEENDIHLFFGNELWQDARVERGRFLRSVVNEAVHKQRPIDEPLLRVALADFTHAIIGLMERVETLKVESHTANDQIETLRREVAIL